MNVVKWMWQRQFCENRVCRHPPLRVRENPRICLSGIFNTMMIIGDAQGAKKLTHWGRDEMNNISQTHFQTWMKMFELRLKFHWSCSINNIPALVQLMAWHRPGDRPLSEPVMVSLPTHICVTRPQWVNSLYCVHHTTSVNCCRKTFTVTMKNYCIWYKSFPGLPHHIYHTL